MVSAVVEDDTILCCKREQLQRESVALVNDARRLTYLIDMSSDHRITRVIRLGFRVVTS